MKRFVVAVPFLLIICGRCASQAQPQSLSPSVAAQVDKVFEKWDKSDSPGCALGVYRDGQNIYKHGYGMADLGNDVPITPATVFHVASMSKQFTAASIVLLAQQGKLSLDDDVHKYLTELPDFWRTHYHPASDLPHQRPTRSVGSSRSGGLALFARPDYA